VRCAFLACVCVCVCPLLVHENISMCGKERVCEKVHARKRDRGGENGGREGGGFSLQGLVRLK